MTTLRTAARRLTRRPPRRPTGAWWCTACGASGVDIPRICRCTRETEGNRS